MFSHMELDICFVFYYFFHDANVRLAANGGGEGGDSNRIRCRIIYSERSL